MEKSKDKLKVFFPKYIDLTKYVKQRPNAKFEDMIYIHPNQCIVLFSEFTLVIYLKNNHKLVIVQNPPYFDRQKSLGKSQRWMLPCSTEMMLFQWIRTGPTYFSLAITNFQLQKQKKNPNEQNQCPIPVFKYKKMHHFCFVQTFYHSYLFTGQYFQPQLTFDQIDPELAQMFKESRPLKSFQNFIINHDFSLIKINKNEQTSVLEFPKNSQVSICKVDRFKKIMVILVQEELKNQLIFFNYEKCFVVSKIKYLRGIDMPNLEQAEQNIFYRRIHKSINVNRRVNQGLSRFIDIKVTLKSFYLLCYEYVPMKRLLMHLSVKSGIFQRFGSDFVRKVVQLIE